MSAIPKPIIHDYGIKFPAKDYVESPYLKDIRVATFSLDHDKGKVIVLGLSARNMADNELFLKFFDNLLVSQLYLPNNTQPSNKNQASS